MSLAARRRLLIAGLLVIYGMSVVVMSVYNFLLWDIELFLRVPVFYIALAFYYVAPAIAALWACLGRGAVVIRVAQVACALALVELASSVLVNWLDDSDDNVMNFSVYGVDRVWFLQTQLHFIACLLILDVIPLICLRYGRGWRLTTVESAAGAPLVVPRDRLTIAAILRLTALVGVTLACIRASGASVLNEYVVLRKVLTEASAAQIAAPIVQALVWPGLIAGILSPRWRLRWIGFAAGYVAADLVRHFQLFATPAWRKTDPLPYFVQFGCQVAALCLTLWLMRWAGYRLVRLPVATICSSNAQQGCVVAATQGQPI